MTINVFEENSTAVVAPVGKIDHVTVEEFESKISEAGESHDALTLENVNNKVMEILNITGFADYLTIE